MKPIGSDQPGGGSNSATTPDGGIPIPLWDQVADRVVDYLSALGIEGRLEIDRLSARVRQRLEARFAAGGLEDPLEAAIEETARLLDRWLDAELGLDGDRHALLTARAAVLSGAVPGWVGRFAGISGESVAAAIRAASVQPVPEAAPLTMEPSAIETCCHGLGRRLMAALKGFIDRPTTNSTHSGSRS